MLGHKPTLALSAKKENIENFTLMEMCANSSYK